MSNLLDATRWNGVEAIRMAMQPGRSGGPGFETDMLRRTVGHDPECFLERSCGSNWFGGSYSKSWDWRLYRSDGSCVAQRLTSRA